MLATQELSERRGQSGRVVRQLTPGRPDGLEAVPGKLEIAYAIGFECRSAAVGFVAVQFDDQVRRSPEEVHGEGTDRDVDLGLGKAAAPAEGEEASLELAAGVVGIQGGLDRETQELRLPQGCGELRLGKVAAEVAKRSGGARDRDVVAPADLVGRERSRAVDDEARAPAATRRRNCQVNVNVNSGWGRWASRPQHPPELPRARMAQDGARSACQDRRHPSSRLAHTSVPDRVDPAIKAVQAPGGDAAKAATLVNPGLFELLERDHSVLPRGDPRDEGIWRGIGELPTHVGG
jgi:hypothetical protein